jgi:hypothetical protein
MRMQRWMSVASATAVLLVTSSSFAAGQGKPDSAATVTTLSPARLNRSTTVLDISVRGKGFSDKSKVRIDGTPRSTTFVSETELRATLSAADVASAGSRSVSVFNPGAGSSNSIALPIAEVAVVPTAPPPPAADTERPLFQGTVADMSLTATSASGATATLVAPIAVDNSGRVTVTAAPYALGVPVTFPVGTNTVTYRATDPSGNFTTVSQRIIVAPLPVAPVSPSISLLYPAGAIPGAGKFPVRVSGSGFKAGMIVRWNGSSRSTQFISSSILLASIGENDAQYTNTARVTVYDAESRTETPPSYFRVDAGVGTLPRITGITPTTGVAGQAVSVRVSGSDVIPGYLLRWKGDGFAALLGSVDTVATFDATGSLVGGIPGKLASRAAAYTVKLLNPGTGGESNGITFTLTAAAQTPARLTRESSESQTALASENTRVAPAVSVRDASDRPIAGIPVQFNVTSGGGVITPASLVTDANGIARATSWRLGSTIGQNTVVVSSPNLASLTFNATATAPAPPAPPAPVATAFQAITPSTLAGSTGAAVSQPPAVIVKDQNGTPFSGASISFTVIAGGGTVSPATQVTGADGIARVTSWTLGPNVGVNQVKASIANTAFATTFTAKVPFPIVAFVKRADGTQIANAQVCVGSRNVIDQYATVKDAGTYGRQTFSVEAVTEYSVTASKGGYTGRTVVLSPTGNSGAITVTLSPGSGGPVCPGAVTSVDAITSIPLPITTTSPVAIPGTSPTYTVATPKFGEQILPLHGRGSGLLVKQPDCAVKGKKAVMGGLTGYSALAVDMITVTCATLMSVNELASAGDGGSIGEKNLATFFNRACDVNGAVGEAVVGISGTVQNGDIRSLAIHCQHLGSNGLAAGPIRKLASVGTVEGTAFGPDLCTNGRVARAIWATQANMTLNLPGSNLGIITPYNAKIVTGVRLICDDTSRP